MPEERLKSCTVISKTRTHGINIRMVKENKKRGFILFQSAAYVDTQRKITKRRHS